MHLSPAAIEGAIRLLDQRGTVTRFGDIVETGPATAENNKKIKGKLVAGAGFEPATFGL